MRKLILPLVAATAVAAPLAVAGSASAAGNSPAHATGDVSWVYKPSDGTYTGTVTFNANEKTGGSLDYANTYGETLHGVVARGTYKQVGNAATFSGTITGGTDFVAGGENHFSAKIVDGGKDGDMIAVFVNSDVNPAYTMDVNSAGIVTGGNLTVH